MGKKTSSLKRRIWFSVILLVVIILLQGVVSFVLESRISLEQKHLTESKDRAKEVEEILASHHEWLSGMLMYIYTGDQFSGSLDYEHCSLGTWLTGDYVINDNSEELAGLIRQVSGPHKVIHETAAAMIDGLNSNTISAEEGKRLFLEEIKPNSLSTIEYLKKIVEYQETQARESERALRKLETTVSVVHVVVIIIAAAAGLMIGIMLIRRLIPPIEAITEAAGRMALGDTDIAIEVNSNDEIGQLQEAFRNMIGATAQQVELAKAVADGDLTYSLEPRSEQDQMVIALNAMILRLREMFEAISVASQQVNAAANQLAAGSQNLAEGTTEQASAVEQIAATVGGVAGNAIDNSRTAREASDISGHLLELAASGTDKMQELDAAMQGINEAAGEIRQVIKLIDDIAFQTNILALNAAIEAARVGNQGKGFAVVAEEVRNLATRSLTAAKGVAELISDSISKADEGAIIARETGDSIALIVEDIKTTGRIIREIAKGSNEQSVALSEISNGVSQVSIVVQRNSLTAEQTAAAAEELSAQAGSLNYQIARFRLEE